MNDDEMEPMDRFRQGILDVLASLQVEICTLHKALKESSTITESRLNEIRDVVRGVK